MDLVESLVDCFDGVALLGQVVDVRLAGYGTTGGLMRRGCWSKYFFPSRSNYERRERERSRFRVEISRKKEKKKEKKTSGSRDGTYTNCYTLE